MPATRFLCAGRKYPNGPEVLRIGCQGRGMPRIWIVRLEFLTGVAAVLNDVPHFCYWHAVGQLSPPDPWHRVPIWQRAPVHPFPVTIFNVYTIWDGTRWNIELEIHIRVGLPTATKQWRFQAGPLGFDSELPDGFILIEHAQNALWTFGGISAQVLVGTYDQIPADTCIGEDEI